MFTRYGGGLRVRALSPSHLGRIQRRMDCLSENAGHQIVNVQRILAMIMGCLQNGQFSRQDLKQLGKWANTRMPVEYRSRNLLWAIFALPDAANRSCTWAIPPRILDDRNRLLRFGEPELEIWLEKVEWHWSRYAANQARTQTGTGADDAAPDHDPPVD